jgi:hypothetical protein
MEEWRIGELEEWSTAYACLLFRAEGQVEERNRTMFFYSTHSITPSLHHVHGITL